MPGVKYKQNGREEQAMVKAATAQRYAHTHAESIGADVGRRIRAARLERGLSLAQLGGDDLSRSFLSLVELGRSRISLRALSIVADRLELPISHFLDDAPGIADAATELMLDSTEAALRRAAPGDALNRLTQEPPSGLPRARYLFLRGWALSDLGRRAEAIEVLRDSLPLVERSGDARFQIQVRYILALTLYAAGNYDESLLHLRQALTRADEIPEDAALLGRLTVCIGHILFQEGDTDGAIEHYNRARQLFGALGDLDNLASMYSGLSQAYERKGDLLAALRYSKLSLGAFEAKQDGRSAASELNNVAVRYEELGDLEHALETAREAVERARTLPDRELETSARSTLASILLRRHDVDGAIAEAEAALSLAPTDAGSVDAWLVLARVAHLQGDAARTDELYSRALEILRESGRHGAYADASLAYSLVLRDRGNTEGALEYALEAAQAKVAHSA
jgi:tetratricopeptide (TPR) repeat protein